MVFVLLCFAHISHLAALLLTGKVKHSSLGTGPALPEDLCWTQRHEHGRCRKVSKESWADAVVVLVVVSIQCGHNRSPEQDQVKLDCKVLLLNRAPVSVGKHLRKLLPTQTSQNNLLSVSHLTPSAPLRLS